MRKILNRILAFTLAFSFVLTAHAQKSESSITLSFIKKADNSKIVSALVMGKKEGGKFQPAQNANINFYYEKDKELVLITKSMTDGHGNAKISLPKEMAVDAEQFFTVTAKVENDKVLEDAEEHIRLKDVVLTVKLNPQDTSRTATAKVTEATTDGSEKPVKDVAINFYVKRLFGIMPAAEEHSVTTGENGEAVFSYPKGIPGDTAGNITVVAMIEDNETYGSVESKTPCTWGKIVPLDPNPFPRATWSAHAPWGMIITLGLLYGGVWFCYFFMFFQLRKIKKEGD